uniref:Ig-like domain-containing protein n=1 Tax=Panagrolaimus sp. JU765 TaxID=591449 RepID=A0AC34RNT1_9BILA
PQPTKLGASQKAPPQVQTQLIPIQGEIGRSARFVCGFSGDEPIIVKWFHNGREIKSAFDTLIRTSGNESTLDLTKLKKSHEGDYTCRLENVAGQVESSANLVVSPPTIRGTAPDFRAKLTDQRVQQNQTAKFSCGLVGEPRPTVTWFKDGKQLPNVERYQMTDTDTDSVLEIIDVSPPDAGVYECVAKNSAGEARCKAKLNIILAKTGKGAEAGPKLEAPHFLTQIEPIVVTEGQNAEFRAKYNGAPEPTIRWYRNNEPIKPGRNYETGHGNGEAWLKITSCSQDDVAEYKVDASNPAGKAATVANLVLKRAEAGPKLEAPHFLTQIEPIVVTEGQNAEFRAKYNGAPEPTIRWYRNNEPIKPGRNYETGHGNGEAWLKITSCSQDDVAEYKVDASNPAGKAATVANLVLKPPTGKLAGSVKPGLKGAAATTASKPASKAPQFLQKLNAINAKQGENVKFVAEIDGDPQPTVSWSFNGRQLFGGRDHKISLTGNKAILEIVRVSTANAGTYQISLKNPSGT